MRLAAQSEGRVTGSLRRSPALCQADGRRRDAPAGRPPGHAGRWMLGCGRWTGRGTREAGPDPGAAEFPIGNSSLSLEHFRAAGPDPASGPASRPRPSTRPGRPPGCPRPPGGRHPTTPAVPRVDTLRRGRPVCRPSGPPPRGPPAGGKRRSEWSGRSTRPERFEQSEQE